MTELSLALLAPVPIEHLLDGVETCRATGRVAYGSRAWEVFAELDRLAGEGTPVLIYASWTGVEVRPEVSWAASYIRYVRFEDYPAKQRLLHRPPSAISEDSEGWWAGYWEIGGLRELDADERIPIKLLRDRKGKKHPPFVPEGPIIVSAP